MFSATFFPTPIRQEQPGQAGIDSDMGRMYLPYPVAVVVIKCPILSFFCSTYYPEIKCELPLYIEKS